MKNLKKIVYSLVGVSVFILLAYVGYLLYAQIAYASISNEKKQIVKFEYLNKTFDINSNEGDATVSSNLIITGKDFRNVVSTTRFYTKLKKIETINDSTLCLYLISKDKFVDKFYFCKKNWVETLVFVETVK